MASGLRTRFERVALAMDPVELQQESGDLSEAELVSELSSEPVAFRVLGYYSARGVEHAFERYGILERLRRAGFEDLKVVVEPSDPRRQTLRILGRGRGSVPVLLLELVVRRITRPAEPQPGGRPRLDLLAVEWLLLQDPTSDFSGARPPLPGQEHPGLGIARDVQELLLQACLRLGLDGVWSSPAHYHGALAAYPEFHFLDPKVEGRFLALRETLSGYAVDEASRLVEAGAVRTRDGRVVGTPAEQVLPASRELRAYLDSAPYKAARDAARRDLLAAGLHVAAPAHPIE